VRNLVRSNWYANQRARRITRLLRIENVKGSAVLTEGRLLYQAYTNLYSSLQFSGDRFDRLRTLSTNTSEGDPLMRKLLGALCLISAFVFSLAVHAAAPASFAGTWTLDKSKSQGLNPRAQNAESVTWTVAQTDKTITIEEKITGGQPAGGPGGGGGQGGPGRGMGGGMMGPRVFNLDGSEVTGETGRGKYVRTAKWANDGKTLELIQKSTFQGPDGEITLTSNDKLELSADGKVLTVTRHSESPRGAQDSTWVLNKN
jgi:hypothetical protein